MINVYTDGSSINNGKSNAIAGIGVYVGDNDKRNISEKLKEQPTNNRAELTAIIRVFDILKNEISCKQKINIYTDSEYSINSLTKWGNSWKKNGWKKKDNNEIKNLDLIKQGHELILNNNCVELIHVKAHTGNEDEHSIGNDKADKLAKQSIGFVNFNNNNVNNNVNNNKLFVFNFGKYKGKDINYVKENDLNYINWCIKNLKNSSIVDILRKNL
tara:strand:+ start:87 stop:731 length:645 start_codon:yes stop_codon:yes gene_type:complete